MVSSPNRSSPLSPTSCHVNSSPPRRYHYEGDDNMHREESPLLVGSHRRVGTLVSCVGGEDISPSITRTLRFASDMANAVTGASISLCGGLHDGSPPLDLLILGALGCCHRVLLVIGLSIHLVVALASFA